MTKYLYYPESLQYAGEAADDVTIPYCLTIAPPSNSSADSIIVADVENNAWIVRPLNSSEIATAQAGQIALLVSAYDLAKQQAVSYTSAGGITKMYQADKKSVENLEAMLWTFQLAGATQPGFYWVAADNTQVPFTYGDMQGLAFAFGAQGALAFQHLQTKKAAVNAATSLSAIQAITW